jgi:hypothetical protein
MNTLRPIFSDFDLCLVIYVDWKCRLQYEQSFLYSLRNILNLDIFLSIYLWINLEVYWYKANVSKRRKKETTVSNNQFVYLREIDFVLKKNFKFCKHYKDLWYSLTKHTCYHVNLSCYTCQCFYCFSAELYLIVSSSFSVAVLNTSECTMYLVFNW